jgi:hypothetical protein
MIVEAQVGATPLPPLTLPARAKIDPALYCYRNWPRTVLAIGYLSLRHGPAWSYARYLSYGRCYFKINRRVGCV